MVRRITGPVAEFPFFQNPPQAQAHRLKTNFWEARRKSSTSSSTPLLFNPQRPRVAWLRLQYQGLVRFVIVGAGDPAGVTGPRRPVQVRLHLPFVVHLSCIYGKKALGDRHHRRVHGVLIPAQTRRKNDQRRRSVSPTPTRRKYTCPPASVKMPPTRGIWARHPSQTRLLVCQGNIGERQWISR